MFERAILSDLKAWSKKPDRKPLVIRGARQVGKTTVVKQFSRNYETYLYFNLESVRDKELFSTFKTIEDLIKGMFFVKNQQYDRTRRTLIFIDEIQQVPEALRMLRYFYENAPDIHIIAAGSMLESLFTKNVSFPVGRVEYMVLRPVSFAEFLGALGETSALEELKEIPIRDYVIPKLNNLYTIYLLIGGMPEIVASYAAERDLVKLKPVYDSLIISYIDDVEKYAHSPSKTEILRHVIRSSFAVAGSRITFEGFGNSSYNSREIGEALRTLEKAFFISLIYPNPAASLPLMPNLRKKPKLQLLDTGLMNYFLGIQKDILFSPDLHHIYGGKAVEHMTGQEMIAPERSALSTLGFWTREKKSSQAEVDYIFPDEGRLIPVEVKSGPSGKLRSLHQFMEEAPHDLAVRFYSGEFSDTKVTTPAGKSFRLLNLPLFLAGELRNYLRWADSR
ncbi:MAG: ATP-binding protein [Ignavibacteriales bacterium]|nr:hypothetical protein [Ignavibacteriaceae bacterium]QOJ27725.1 MAG: ATP-binding protein [Ignavibacteriales bacterium]